MNRRAFTLIEVLTVIVIIGVLTSLTAYAWSSVSRRSRNNVRKTDLERIRGVLQQYYSDNRTYPVTSDPTIAHCALGTDKDQKFSKLISPVPQDPGKKIGDCNLGSDPSLKGYYLYLSEKLSGSYAQYPKTFALLATLEQTSDPRVTDPMASYNLSEQYYDQNYLILGSNGR
jgi:prepilin-type N-terminal cleavage/methylation domain-containing protein